MSMNLVTGKPSAPPRMKSIVDGEPRTDAYRTPVNRPRKILSLPTQKFAGTSKP